jgi:glycosyltransferase 2 family protein
MQTALKRVSLLIPLVMLPLGVWLGYRTFRGKSFDAILEAVASIPSLNLGLAFACAAASYACLSGFDALAIRYLGRELAYPKIALTSFVSLGIGHTVGVAVLSSGALRYRFYSGFGLKAAEVGKLIVFCALTVGLGLLSLAGLILFLRPDLGLGAFKLPPTAVRAIGILCLGLIGLYIGLARTRKKPLRIRGHEFRLPSAGLAAAQILLGTVNFAFVAAALHQLLAGAAPYSQTVAVYVTANVTGLVSHVPGGIGVLEFVISSLVANGNVVGALIAFRIVYFLVPLVLAATLLVIAEIVRWRRG